VLYKRFELALFKNSPPIQLPIYEDIFDRIIGWVDPSGVIPTGPSELDAPSVGEVRGKDYVVLPLYSTRNRNFKVVAEKSGINQWNAGGRERKFGESYIPIPQEIHNQFPGFFPGRDVKFKLLLPSGKIVSAKVCQENSKALMSDPNTDLCEWLYSTVDGADPNSSSRFRDQRPFTYEDLVRVGKDSVKIIKSKGQPYQYELHSGHLGAYDEFISPEETADLEIN